MKEKASWFRLLAAALVLSVTMSGCFGCGGAKTISLQLDSTHQQPVWVGIYLLSKEAALDGRPNSDLTDADKARSLGPSDGVIDHEVRPVYPGEPVTFVREKYDPAVSWILVVANIPKPDPCTRAKVPVKKGSDVKLRLSVVDKCVNVVKKG